MGRAVRSAVRVGTCSQDSSQGQGQESPPVGRAVRSAVRVGTCSQDSSQGQGQESPPVSEAVEHHLVFRTVFNKFSSRSCRDGTGRL